MFVGASCRMMIESSMVFTYLQRVAVYISRVRIYNVCIIDTFTHMVTHA